MLAKQGEITERKINQLVYELYRVTPEEIVLVENESETTHLSHLI